MKINAPILAHISNEAKVVNNGISIQFLGRDRDIQRHPVSSRITSSKRNLQSARSSHWLGLNPLDLPSSEVNKANIKENVPSEPLATGEP